MTKKSTVREKKLKKSYILSLRSWGWKSNGFRFIYSWRNSVTKNPQSNSYHQPVGGSKVARTSQCMMGLVWKLIFDKYSITNNEWKAIVLLFYSPFLQIVFSDTTWPQGAAAGQKFLGSSWEKKSLFFLMNSVRMSKYFDRLKNMCTCVLGCTAWWNM